MLKNGQLGLDFLKKLDDRFFVEMVVCFSAAWVDHIEDENIGVFKSFGHFLGISCVGSVAKNEFGCDNFETNSVRVGMLGRRGIDLNVFNTYFLAWLEGDGFFQAILVETG